MTNDNPLTVWVKRTNEKHDGLRYITGFENDPSIQGFSAYHNEVVLLEIHEDLLKLKRELTYAPHLKGNIIEVFGKIHEAVVNHPDDLSIAGSIFDNMIDDIYVSVENILKFIEKLSV